jgi:hypothetical protein
MFCISASRVDFNLTNFIVFIHELEPMNYLIV